MQQAILTSSAILAYVLLTQYERRRFSWPRWLPAIIAIPVAAAVYLSRAPAHRYDIYLYLVGAAAGCGFGALAAATTRVEQDPGAGRLYTRCGPAFAATWATAMGTRVAFIWALQDVPWFAHTAGPFLRDHQIGRSAIAAAFVLMAVTMYGLRFAVIAVRARQLPSPGHTGQPGNPGAPPADRQPASRTLEHRAPN
jgi:drug/metabolite transporter (DMT)-like permease